MQAKDDELLKVKEKHLYAEQQLQEMEEKQHQVKLMETTMSITVVVFSSSGNW